MWVSLPPVLCLTDVVMDMARKYDAVHKPYATRQSGPDGHAVPPHSAKKHVPLPCHSHGEDKYFLASSQVTCKMPLSQNNSGR